MADKLTERITAILQEHSVYSEDLPAALAAELRKLIPAVAFKGPDDTDLTLLQGAAAKLDCGYSPGGGNVTYAVSRLLRLAAMALEGCTAEELEARTKSGYPR